MQSLFDQYPLLKTLLDQTTIGIYLLDIEGKFSYVNRSLTEMIGYPAVDTLGGSPLEAVPLAEREIVSRELKDRLSGKKDKSSYITRLVIREGREIDVSLDSNTLYDQNGRIIGVLGFVRDITQSLELAKHRQWFETQAFTIEKLKALGRLATTVVHQINNPLEAMKNYLYLLKTEFQENDSRYEMLATIEQEVFRIARLTHQLAEFAIPGSTEFILFDVCQLLEETLNLLDKKIRLAEVSIEKNCPTEPPLVRGLPDHLRQAFVNLIFNALEAMEGGGTLRISVTCSETEMELRFCDSGRGIPTEHLKKIFDPFFTTKDPSQFFGLGLSVTLQIVHNHGGSIRVESKKNKGTCFIINLPIPMTS